ncbi:MAG: KH domain-containing protein [Parachlamydiaceae bacterium]
MKEFIQYIIKNLVDSPNDVDIRCVDSEKGVVVEVRVAGGDVGKVVGRKGVTINALRTIITSACARLGQRVHLEIID